MTTDIGWARVSDWQPAPTMEEMVEAGAAPPRFCELCIQPGELPTYLPAHLPIHLPDRCAGLLHRLALGLEPRLPTSRGPDSSGRTFAVEVNLARRASSTRRS